MQRKQRLWLGLILAVMLMLGPLGTLVAYADEPDSVQSALAYLLSQQADDGSFGGSVGSSIEAVLAGAAAGQDVSAWRTGASQPSVMDYLATNARSYAQDASTTGKLLAAVAAAGQDPTAYGGLDLVEQLLSFQQDSGALAATALGQAWAMLGLMGARQTLPTSAVADLVGLQQDDGGWEGGPGWGTDSNTTALVLQTLLAAGTPRDAAAIAKGVTYLASQVSPVGGFTYSNQWGSDADANSTAYGLQALIALGESPTAAPWSVAGLSMADALRRFQIESGAFEWQTGQGENLLATVQAIPALLGKAYPLLGPEPTVVHAASYLNSQQAADGSFSSGFGSDVAASAQALLAYAAAGVHNEDLLSYLRANAATLTDAGAAGQLANALALSGEDPRAFGPANSPVDLVAAIEAGYDAETGAYDPSGSVWNQTSALLGLAAAGESVPAKALDWLRAAQNADGGWGWASGQTSDSNSTAMVIQALVAAGLSSDASISRGLTYLRAQQAEDGGFAYDLASNPAADANSTALGLQALIAVGATPANDTAAQAALARLQAFQLADGALEWQSGQGANLLATVQGLPALAGASFVRISAASQATPLLDRVSGVLAGDQTGTFARYSLTASGEGGDITLTLGFQPDDPSYSASFGIVVYGPQGEIARTPTSGDPGVRYVTFATGAPGTYVVQVFNYAPGTAISYTLER